MHGWINEDREFLLWRERLDALRMEWERVQKSEDALLRGPLLIEAQRWFDQRNQDLSEQERIFIITSRELRERLEGEKKERQQKELTRARALAENQKDAVQKLQRRAIVAAGAAVVALILLVMSVVLWHAAQEQARIANVQRTAAEEQARIAETRRIAAQASEKKANDARGQADALINFMLYDLRDKLEPIGRLDVLDDVAKKAKEYLDSLPKELVTASRLEQQTGMLDNLGDVRVAQGKLQDALEAYQQNLAISKRLAEQDKSNSGWQRDLIVSLYKVGTITAKIGGNDNVTLAQGFLRTGLNLAEQYRGPDRQNLIDVLDLASRNLVH